MWEFPGGKLEAGVTPVECLKRELREEMQLAIEPYAYFGTNDHCYGEKHIQLIAYKAHYISGTIKLVDHDEFRWVNRNEIGEYTFAPTNVPFVNRLMEKVELSSPGSDAGFISAGQGKWYSNTLNLLKPGARVFVCIPKVGYVGVGIVTDEVVPSGRDRWRKRAAAGNGLTCQNG
ncbi:(deoxy)nucleoside triphosphate pyrophosphohydrolase [Paenibacillus sp. Y412MC10]|uniref:(deoxy)nucleoside triphosphate pyrophosphohydrolase n=1 Tax=Geobacillus sp. (strain Y412MC10) TaxID=481743 RepID=UPI0021B358B5|nr:(deoxy)nucleoside triphosphate pyrophosphohydrolase [Paenibacillus sp. Y412MC10]